MFALFPFRPKLYVLVILKTRDVLILSEVKNEQFHKTHHKNKKPTAKKIHCANKRTNRYMTGGLGLL